MTTRLTQSELIGRLPNSHEVFGRLGAGGSRRCLLQQVLLASQATSHRGDLGKSTGTTRGLRGLLRRRRSV
jgi:hypothetical protein